MNVPLHLFTRVETALWVAGGQTQRALAAKLANQYRTGVGVLSCTYLLIAYVQPNGLVRLLAPPFQRFEPYQIANKPRTDECACADFFDPETGGPWRNRGSEDHHPVCMFDRHALRVAVGNNRLHAEGKARPDTLDRLREEARGERGNKTGARTG